MASRPVVREMAELAAPLVCSARGLPCVDAGAGLELLRDELTPHAVRAAVAALLDRPGCRLAGRRIPAEIAAMPTPFEALAAITRLSA
jgi:hypothetical protein